VGRSALQSGAQGEAAPPGEKIRPLVEEQVPLFLQHARGTRLEALFTYLLGTRLEALFTYLPGGKVIPFKLGPSSKKRSRLPLAHWVFWDLP
jgi:hypothetical protein